VSLASDRLDVVATTAGRDRQRLEKREALLYTTETAPALLVRAFGADALVGGSLPEDVEEWVAAGVRRSLVVVRGGLRLRVDALGDRPAALPTRDALRGLSLSPRDAGVLARVAQGSTNAEIAGLLLISPRTVKKHLESVYGKLGVSSRAAAVSPAVASA
jgi:DNA-binding CsgD family transcriptional regulator